MGTVRRLFVAGNWKMNLSRAEAAQLASALVEQGERFASLDVAVCPASLHLFEVRDRLTGSKILLGGQNMHFEKSGAFTGEVSAAMLADAGCQYVLIGHSERRHTMGETNEQINRKMHSALAGGLKPILCVGEILSERQSGKTNEILDNQLRGGLLSIGHEMMREVTIAYEPVWAIGTGETATPAQAEEAHLFIRKLLTEIFGADVAQIVRILYGGSVKPDNTSGLLSNNNVDGALVGGASLKAQDFLGILHAAATLKK